uniref:EGF-like domain-containing protein n=1 Tax=Haemonchus contortus TaxID=6289 RepID=A0A7I4XVE7_HAECO
MSDYTAVSKFFNNYFNGICPAGTWFLSSRSISLIPATITFKQIYFPSPQTPDYSAFLISSNGASSVVKATLYSPTSNKEVELCLPEAVGKDLAVVTFKCSEFTSGTYALRIYPDQTGTTSFSGNVIVFEKTLDLTTSVAFSANTNEDADSGILYFNQPQYVAVKMVGSAYPSRHTVTLKDENGTILVDHAPAISRDHCLFPFVLDYEWWCRKANGVYQVQVDSTVGSTDITRTQILTCLDKGGQACVHGKLDTDQNCICDMGWAGADCLTRVCQNGGTTLPDNTCACVPGQYAGEFCQTSLLSCSSSPDLPYFANEVASLILVVERSTTPLTLDITSAIMRSISGTQIVLVYYGGGLDPTVMLSTTDSQLFSIFLKQQPPEDVNPSAPPESPYNALLLGMKAQLTARALLVLVSRGGEFPIDELFVKQLSLQRVDLRVFTEQYSSNFSTLAMLGNGISFVANRDDFQEVYFPNYIVPIASKATTLSSPILNVIASDTSCNATISIPAEDFSASLKLFVHVINGTVTVVQGGSAVDSTKFGGGTYPFTVSSQVETTISISGNDQCSYLVEILNYYKVGYVFQKNNLDENGFLGPVSGSNYVSLSAANTPFVSDVSMMPRIQLRPITKTGTLGNVIPVKTTVKSSACAYSYIAELNCTTDIFGYQAQIQTFSKTSSMRHQQITMVCLQLDSCKNGGQFTDGTCKCEGWEGADCGLPTCMNGGVRENGVCICSPNTSGKFCEEVQPLHLAFILDSVGQDDTAFNSSITAILEFTGLYNMEELQIMLTDNAYKFTLNRNFASYTGKSLYSTLTQLFPYRDDTGDIKLDDVFSTIQQNAVDLNLTSSNNYVFYVTQSGGKLQNSAILDDLRLNHSFTISCIGVSAYDRTLPPSTLDELTAIGVTKTADNWYTAMMEMANITQNVDNPPPSPPARPQCVNEQLSIFFAVDLSKGVDPYRQKILAILNMFLTAFNLGYDILSGNDGCNQNGDISAAYNGSSRISGWTYFDQWLGVPSPSFCVSNLGNVMASTQRDEGDSPSPSLNTTGKGLMRSFTRILNNTCLCSRYNDDSTKKIVIWIPFAGYNSTNYNSLLSFAYLHYVVPLYQPYDGDFYYGLSQNGGKLDGLIADAANSTPDSIVKTLWSKLCGQH